MFLHEIPAIAEGLDRLIAEVPHFAGADRARFVWRKREPGFAGLLRIVLGQQVSTHAAAAMVRRLESALPELAPQRFLDLDDDALAAIGFSRAKMRYGRALANAVISDPHFLRDVDEAPDDDAIARLTALPGIGRWSAQLYLMFCLGRADIWPTGDLGIVLGAQYLLGLAEKPRPDAVETLGLCWKPDRSAAALLVWDHYMQVAATRRREQSAAKKSSLSGRGK